MRLLKPVLLTLVILTGVACLGQQIPVGTVLPLELETSLKSNKMRSGDFVKARLMQDVPLEGNSKLRAGSKVFGHILSGPGTQTTTPEISLRFDTLVEGKRRIPITTSLRALASPMDVEDAKVPTTGPDRGTSEADWVTEQIGGETLYHGSVVTHGSHVVGKYVPEGVLVQVSASPGLPCRGVMGTDRPQALWLFSSDACGVYGLPNLTIEHWGRKDPLGEIRVRSEQGPVKIPAGSGMLLRVIP